MPKIIQITSDRAGRILHGLGDDGQIYDAWKRARDWTDGGRVKVRCVADTPASCLEYMSSIALDWVPAGQRHPLLKGEPFDPLGPSSIQAFDLPGSSEREPE